MRKSGGNHLRVLLPEKKKRALPTGRNTGADERGHPRRPAYSWYFGDKLRLEMLTYSPGRRPAILFSAQPGGGTALPPVTSHLQANW